MKDFVKAARRKAERNSTVNLRAKWRCKLMSLRAKKKKQAQLVQKIMPCRVINDRSTFQFSLLFEVSRQEDRIHDNALGPRMRGEPMLLLRAKVVVVILEAKVEGRVLPGTSEP